MSTDTRTTLTAMVYTVTTESVASNKTHVAAVVAALHARGCGGQYASVNVPGTGKFIHVLQPAVGQVLDDLPEFHAFVSNLKAIKVDGPIVHDLELVAGDLEALAVT